MFAELLKRRIPQILGMYVAAVWLCVEIADWMSERFPVPENFSAYVFVLLLTMAPAVAVLAWGHGKPGKDQWTKGQVLLIVMNVLLSLFAVWYWVASPKQSTPMPPAQPIVKEGSKAEISNNPSTKPSTQSMAITETVIVKDELSGESVAYEVPIKGMSQKVSLSFLPNNSGDDTLDWLQYGASWLLGKDLNRTPLIAVETPLNSESMRLAVQDKGYADGLGEPLALSLQVAKKRSAQWLIRGEIIQQNNEVAFKADMYDVLTGALVKTVTHQHANWLTALDDISTELSEVILAEHPSIKQQIPNLSIADHVSSDLSAIKNVVTALHAVAFDNDYQLAKEALLQAIDSDGTFAEAYMLQMKMHVDSGEFVQAAEKARKTLSFDHKLYGEDVFEVKARLYSVTGEEDKALRVLENWAKVYPESVRAWLSLANNYLLIGNRLDDAAAAFERLRDIEPGSKHLLRLSNVHVLREDFDAAIQVLKAYQKYEPDNVEAILALGKVRKRQGRFEDAKAYFESAELMVNGDIRPELELAKVEAAVGDVAQAEAEMLSLLERANNDAEKLSIFWAVETLYTQTGRLRKGYDINEMSEPVSKASLSPISYLLNFNGKKVGYLTALGEKEVAKALIEALLEKTEPPFNEMLVYMRLAYYSTLDDKEGLEKYLSQAKHVMKSFKMSVYQQFIFNYEAMIKRLNGEFDEALKLHDLAIKESIQSIVTFNTLEVLLEMKRQKVKTLVAKQDYQVALQVLDEVAVHSPRSAECMLLRAETLYLMGQVTTAKEALSQLDTFWAKADPEYIEYQKFQQLKAKMAQDISKE